MVKHTIKINKAKRQKDKMSNKQTNVYVNNK